MLNEISVRLSIFREFDDLLATDWKGFIYPFMDVPLHQAVVAMAERRLEKLGRNRTGRGAWFAVVKAVKTPLGPSLAEKSRYSLLHNAQRNQGS